jgi:hypothetical protein
VSAGLVVRLGNVFCCLRKPASLRIPGSVPEIGDRAFSRLNSVTDLSFEEGLLTVGASAFSGCSKLKKASFPVSLTVIDVDIFQGCKGLS